MASELTEIVSAIGGILGAIGALYAARAASRSAALAQQSAYQVENAERRATTREFITNAQRILVEAKRVESLAADLKLQYKTLFNFAGSSGGSMEQLYIERVDKNLQSIVPLAAETQQLIDSYRQIAATSEDDLNEALSKLEQNLVTVQGARKEFQRELAEVTADNRLHREKRIRGPYPLNQSSFMYVVLPPLPSPADPRGSLTSPLVRSQHW